MGNSRNQNTGKMSELEKDGLNHHSDDSDEKTKLQLNDKQKSR